MEANGFKACPACGFTWPQRKDFIQDPAIEIIGYQVDFDDLGLGLLLFNHACEGTLSIPAGIFGDLYDGPIYERRSTGTDACPGYCLNQDELEPCPATCECAYVREIMQVFRNR